MDTQTGIIDEIRASLDDGANLTDVRSTDEQLVLVLASGEDRHRFRLDANATRALLEDGLIDRLTTPKTRSTPAIA